MLAGPCIGRDGHRDRPAKETRRLLASRLAVRPHLDVSLTKEASPLTKLIERIQIKKDGIFEIRQRLLERISAGRGTEFLAPGGELPIFLGDNIGHPNVLLPFAHRLFPQAQPGPLNA